MKTPPIGDRAGCKRIHCSPSRRGWERTFFLTSPLIGLIERTVVIASPRPSSSARRWKTRLKCSTPWIRTLHPNLRFMVHEAADSARLAQQVTFRVRPSWVERRRVLRRDRSANEGRQADPTGHSKRMSRDFRTGRTTFSQSCGNNLTLSIGRQFNRHVGGAVSPSGLPDVTANGGVTRACRALAILRRGPSERWLNWQRLRRGKECPLSWPSFIPEIG